MDWAILWAGWAFGLFAAAGWWATTMLRAQRAEEASSERRRALELAVDKARKMFFERRRVLELALEKSTKDYVGLRETQTRQDRRMQAARRILDGQVDDCLDVILNRDCESPEITGRVVTRDVWLAKEKE